MEPLNALQFHPAARISQCWDPEALVVRHTQRCRYNVDIFSSVYSESQVSYKLRLKYIQGKLTQNSIFYQVLICLKLAYGWNVIPFINKCMQESLLLWPEESKIYKLPFFSPGIRQQSPIEI